MIIKFEPKKNITMKKITTIIYFISLFLYLVIHKLN